VFVALSGNAAGAFAHPSSPTVRQFNDVSAEADAGVWTHNLTQRTLQIDRIGSTSVNNAAGITRHTDLSGPAAMLRLVFDVAGTNWTATPYQSNALTLSVGRNYAVGDYGSSEVHANTFQTIAVRGKGPGTMAVTINGAESAQLPADGRQYRITLLLNKSAPDTQYLAPDGSVRTLRTATAVLWVGSTLVADVAASNGTTSGLTDLRLRLATGGDALWTVDDITAYRHPLPLG